jgi:hypothetical protein
MAAIPAPAPGALSLSFYSFTTSRAALLDRFLASFLDSLPPVKIPKGRRRAAAG